MSSISLRELNKDSFMVVGNDTIKFKDTLKAFGGKWNTTGWVFGNSHKTQISKFLELINMKVEKPVAAQTSEEICLKNYTDKSFVLYGDTKQHKDKIKELGGKWNANLRDGMKGWVFSMKKKAVVEEFVKSIKEEIFYEADSGDMEVEESEDEESEEEEERPKSLLRRIIG